MENSYPDAIGKTISNENIVLVENDDIVNDNDDIVKILNSLFSNINKVLGIYQTWCKYFVEETKDPVLKLLWKTANYIRDSLIIW